MSVSSFERMMVGIVVSLATMGCDATTCIRNSDCPSPLVCSSAACALPPAEGGVDSADAASPVRDGAIARPDSGMRVDAGGVDAGVESTPDAGGGAIDASIDAGIDASVDAGILVDGGPDAMVDGG